LLIFPLGPPSFLDANTFIYHFIADPAFGADSSRAAATEAANGERGAALPAQALRPILRFPCVFGTPQRAE
jgi:hypothetical protein